MLDALSEEAYRDLNFLTGLKRGRKLTALEAVAFDLAVSILQPACDAYFRKLMDMASPEYKAFAKRMSEKYSH